MNEGLLFEQVSCDAVFVVDSRQFECGTYKYDEHIANSLIHYGVKAERDTEESTNNNKEDSLS